MAGDLLLGVACAGCDQPGAAVCRSCHDALRATGVRRVQRTLPGFPVTFARGGYDGPLGRLIITLKEKQGLALVGTLGDLITPVVARMATTSGVGAICLVPVPSARARVRERGYDVTGLLARRCAGRLRRMGLRVEVRSLLEQRPGVADQGALSLAERLANQRHAIRVRGATELPIVLLDDIVTTGATLAAAADAVETNRLRVLGAAVLADTPKRFGSGEVA